MKVTTTMGNCSVGNCKCNHDYELLQDADDGAAKAVVVVGVKLDSRSKELLTWALVKVARSGDRVIALHVVDPNTEDKTTLLSLVKTFDSVLAAYEGFCNLKQVDLKLKVSRGSPVRKILAREAVYHGASSLIVGASETQRPIWPAVAVAKYCARNVGKGISVVAVNNGKILFQREAEHSIGLHLQDFDSKQYRIKKNKMTLAASPLSLEPRMVSDEASSSQLSLNGGKVDDSLALVPVQDVPKLKTRWTLLQKVLLHKHKVSSKHRFSSQSSFATISPVHEQDIVHGVHSLNLDEGAMMSDDSPSPNSTSCFISKELEGLREKYSSICKLFSYKELLSATSNFSVDNMVGKGGSSRVYKGILPDGKLLAVKILKPSKVVMKQFVSEIEVIMSLKHSNIITLVGFCFEDNNLLLVYDLLSRGSLEDNLHGNRKLSSSFGWEERFKVALGIAEALEHLHRETVEPIIHRDVKSSNILLSDTFDPKLADFGLAVLSSSSSNHVQSIDVAGTFGYLAPEYFMHGKMNEKIDIYAYGVVLLELVSGRKPIDRGCPKGTGSLVTWAKQTLKGGKISDLVDPSLPNSHDCEQIERMVLAASLCIRLDSQLRPHAGLVVKLLHGDSETIEWARQQVDVIEEVDSLEGEQSSTNIQSFIKLAFLNLEDDSHSTSSTNEIISVEDYLQGRWSRTSSFD